MSKILLIFILLQVTIEAKERIIALSPAINEIIFALDSGEEIVANTDYALYPEASKKIPKVGGYFSPNLEKIVALRPSLVIMQNNNYRLSLKLQRLGIKTKIMKIDKLQSIKDAIRKIGEILNKKDKASTIIEDIEEGISQLKNIVHNKKILIVFGNNKHLNKQIFVAGQNLYFDEIIKKSTNINALESKRKGQPILNMENIIATNPDIVLLLARDTNKKLTRNALIAPWLKLPISAAKTKAIYINSHIYAGVPSNRLTLFLHDFKNMLQDYNSTQQYNSKLKFNIMSIKN